MQNIITLDVLSAVSENGFSLDELVLAAKTLFEQEGLNFYPELQGKSRNKLREYRIRALLYTQDDYLAISSFVR